MMIMLSPLMRSFLFVPLFRFVRLLIYLQDEKFQDKKYKFLGKISFGLIKRPEED
jgi:hypothetical protein